MISTAQKVLERCQLKKQADGRYRGSSPLRSGSDSNAFVLKIDDGEHGTYTDHVSDESGSLYDLAKRLDIALPANNRVAVPNSKSAYADLLDYATRHYVAVEVFEKAGWEAIEHQGRAALRYPTANGNRIRFIGDKSDKDNYRAEKTGYKACWYGLSKAPTMAYQGSLPLVICNGESSTVVAQHFGIPAIATTAGEKATKGLPDDLLAELQGKWSGQIYIALDCDDTGNKAAQVIQAQLKNSIVIDLGLTDKGDLANFCGLHGDKAMLALKRIAGLERKENEKEIADSHIEFLGTSALLGKFLSFVQGDKELFGRTIKMPFESMRRGGGFSEIITTKKVWLIGNVSGGGKTIWSETINDGFNRAGYNTMYIGDEWSAMEMTARMVQRNSNGNPISYMDYLRYMEDEIEFSDSDVDRVARIIRSIRTMPGQTYYMSTKEGFSGVIFLENIMAAADIKIKALATLGIRIDVIILDYLSLYDTRSQAGNNPEEYKVGLFKSYCKSLDVLGISTVQVNKQAEDRVKAHGGYLTQHDLHYVRADKGNLISTMNRIYQPKFEALPVDSNEPAHWKPHIDVNGNPVLTPNIALVTAKNSVGKPFEYAFFHFDWLRLRIIEGLHPDYEYDGKKGIVVKKEEPVSQNGNVKVDTETGEIIPL